MEDGVDASKFGWIEIALFYGVILFFAFRELWLLRRHRKAQERASQAKAAADDDKANSMKDGGKRL
jgi:hypothetical protein